MNSPAGASTKSILTPPPKSAAASFGSAAASGFRFVVCGCTAFGGSIFVHELGHFLAARKRGLKIERFSIGFGPRLFGWTGKDGVDYRVSIIPLGGYVALPETWAKSTRTTATWIDRALREVGYIVSGENMRPRPDKP